MKIITPLLFSLCLTACDATTTLWGSDSKAPQEVPKETAKEAAPAVIPPAPAETTNEAPPQALPAETPQEVELSQNSISSIAAVVNDDVVSSLDLENRMHMVLATTQLQDTPETREHLRPQILRSLIDEKLQTQEATKNGIEIKQEDLDHAITTIEQQRGMVPGELLQKLDSLGVPRSTFLDQIRAQLAWTKLIVKVVRPKIKVSDDEIERERTHMQQETGASEMQIEVLGLPVDHPEDDMQVQQLAEKLADGVRAGASFESVARELGGPSAASAQNLEPFWVPVDQMEPMLAKALEHVRPGAVVGPVRTLEGYTLAKLVDERRAKAPPASADVTEVKYKDILLKLKPDASAQDANLILDIGKEVAKHPGTCAEEGLAGIENTKDYDIEVHFRSEALQSLPDPVKDIVGRLSVGGVSEPVASPEGIRLLMLCERVEKPAQQAGREEAGNRLLHQKLELEADKYLRNLRRDATIDIRG